MSSIKVVCGIIFKEGKVLLCKRNASKSLPGYWEFPGGKIEPGETLQESLHRELKEELGMEIKIVKPFESNVHEYENFKVELRSFICEYKNATFSMTDHDSFEWVNVNTLKTWNLAPADIPIAEALIIEQENS